MILILLGGCAAPVVPRAEEPASKPTILSPRPGQSFWDGDPIVLLTDSPGSVSWTTSEGIEVATRASATVTLPPGSHRINLCVNGKVSSSIEVSVRSLYLGPGVRRQQLIKAGSPWVRPFGLVQGLGANLETGSPLVMVPPASPARLAPGLSRDVRLTPPVRPTPWLKNKTLSRSIQPNPDLGTILPFRVADLVSGGFITRNFQLTHRTESLEIWFDQATVPEVRQQLNAGWLIRFHSVVQDRLTPTWGTPPDLDGNGRVRILLTPSLNDAAIAVGFFNPSDLFPRVDAPGPEQNPISNEGEYLYLAVPSDSHPFFSLPSLAATVAHEGFHLIHYGTRVLRPWLTTGVVVPDETVAISEGLAHLSEALCGYSLSGGDVVYVEEYLKAPSRTSFTGSDLDGSTDTLSKRGAWLLFLGWIDQNLPDGPRILSDLMKPSSSIGWARLSQVLGSSADEAFLRWAESLQTTPANPPLLDSETGEPLILTGWEGDLEWSPGYRVSLQGPQAVPFGSATTLPPHGLVFWAPETWSQRLEIPGSQMLGQGFLTLDWVGR